MPRSPRVEQAGYYHIINRGVARMSIFLKDDDFKKFLEIVAIAKDRYDFTLHSFCLMSNHYHLLLETKHENLSLIMRQINSTYAQYFNKTYGRIGPLWQGRFKNWYVYTESYLYILLRYIEQNPIKAQLTKYIGEYRYSSSWSILNIQNMKLLENSMLLDSETFEISGKVLTNDEIKRFERYQKTKFKSKSNKGDKKPISQKQKELNAYFLAPQDFTQRNQNILKAVKDGYTQSEIGRHLGLSRSTVSNIMKRKTKV